jgi:hypothetical protein
MFKLSSDTRDCFEYFLGDKAYDCALWAFGEGFETEEAIDLLDRWNKLHGDKLLLHEDDTILDDVEKIVNLWKSHVR